LYGRRPVAPPPPLPLCRGLATAVGHEAEITESTKKHHQTENKRKQEPWGGGATFRPPLYFRSRATAPIAAEGRAPWLLTWRGGQHYRPRHCIGPFGFAFPICGRIGAQVNVPQLVRAFKSWCWDLFCLYLYTPEGYVPVRAQFRPAQAPKGTEFTSRPDEFHLILVCAREERAKPIGDRRGGRWSPCGAGAEAGRGRRPRGFSV
jgi:hypothetical protein